MTESTALSLSQQAQAQLPAMPDHLKGRQVSDLGNQVASNAYTQFAKMSIRQSKFSISENGVKETLIDNETGMPKQFVEIVIIGGNEKRARAYYPGKFEPDATEPPTCWSNDGVTPTGGKQIQAKQCGLCKWNEPGSRKDARSNRATACSVRKRIVICSYRNPTKPILMDLPVTSHQNLARYVKWLKDSGITPEVVRTKIMFDPDPELDHPRLVFEWADWLTEEQDEAVQKSIADNAELIQEMVMPNSNSAQTLLPDDSDDRDGEYSKTAVDAANANNDAGNEYPAQTDGNSSDTIPPQESASEQDVEKLKDGADNAAKQTSASDDFGGGSEPESKQAVSDALDGDDIPESAKGKPLAKAAPGEEDVGGAVAGLSGADF